MCGFTSEYYEYYQSCTQYPSWIYLIVKDEMRRGNIVKDKIKYKNSDLKNH